MATKISVNRAAPQPDRLTFQQLRFRRVRSYPDPSPELREWRNMRVGGNPSYQFPRLPRPEEIGTPRDLYAACKSGEVIAWGRDRSGEMKPIPVAEWAEEAPPKAWVEFRFNWKDINRVFSGIGSDNIDTRLPVSKPGTRTNREETAEQKCREWIASLTEPPENVPTAFLLAQKAVAPFGCLSGAAFKRAWADCARPEWHKAGAKRRNQRP